MNAWIVALVLAIVVALLALTAGGRSRRGGGSTAGHYDPDAIGGYTLDRATMRYRYDLPTMPRAGGPPVPGNAPPHRRRRRRPSGEASGQGADSAGPRA